MLILHLRSGRLLSSRQWFLVLIVPLWLSSACSTASTPTPFIPPTAPAPLIEPTFIINPTQNVTVIQSTPLPTILPTTNPEDCVNSLTFIEDLTIPDNSFITYGA